MSFGDNLQFYRKSRELTQEDFAEQMGVSRQTVSKWESGASFPEMEKLIQMCSMFGCSMDTLVRGDAEKELATDSTGYDKQMNGFSKAIALGVFLILLGVSLLLFMSGFGANAGIAVAVLLAFIIVAVAIFVVFGMKQDNFETKHPFIVPFYTEEQKESFKNKAIYLIAGSIAAIMIGVIILIVMCEVIERPAAFSQEMWESLAAGILLLIIAFASATIVYAALQLEKYDVEHYNAEHNPDPETKRRRELAGKICACIMLLATAIYVVLGCLWGRWDNEWWLFAAGGILCAIVCIVLNKDEE